MRRVIQKTVTTTRIVSLTITHSESAEEVEYTLIEGADQLNEPQMPASDQDAVDYVVSDRAADDELPQATTDIAGDAAALARP